MTAAATMHDYDPLRDKTYQSTRLGRDVADFLAWLELGGSSPRTLDQYERDLARGALLFPSKGVADLIMPANGGNQGAWRIRTADRCLSVTRLVNANRGAA